MLADSLCCTLSSRKSCEHCKTGRLPTLCWQTPSRLATGTCWCCAEGVAQQAVCQLFVTFELVIILCSLCGTLSPQAHPAAQPCPAALFTLMQETAEDAKHAGKKAGGGISGAAHNVGAKVRGTR